MRFKIVSPFGKFCALKEPVKALSPEDARHLQASRGWLELGDCDSAMQEIEGISFESRTHPEVLRLRWEIFGKAGKWIYAETMATSLHEKFPQNAFWHYASALSLHMLGRSQEALDLMAQIGKAGDMSGDMLYLAARLNCCLGDIPTAKMALKAAFDRDTRYSVQNPHPRH